MKAIAGQYRTEIFWVQHRRDRSCKNYTSCVVFLSQIEFQLSLHHVRRRYCCSCHRQRVRHVQSRFRWWRCSTSCFPFHCGKTQTSGKFRSIFFFFFFLHFYFYFLFFPLPNLLLLRSRFCVSRRDEMSLEWFIDLQLLKRIRSETESTHAIGIVLRVSRTSWLIPQCSGSRWTCHLGIT